MAQQQLASQDKELAATIKQLDEKLQENVALKIELSKERGTTKAAIAKNEKSLTKIKHLKLEITHLKDKLEGEVECRKDNAQQRDKNHNLAATAVGVPVQSPKL